MAPDLKYRMSAYNSFDKYRTDTTVG